MKILIGKLVQIKIGLTKTWFYWYQRGMRLRQLYRKSLSLLTSHVAKWQSVITFSQNIYA
jgi:hypothetical protein